MNIETLIKNNYGYIFLKIMRKKEKCLIQQI